MNLLAFENPDLPAWLRLSAANSNPATAVAQPVSSEPVGLHGLMQGLSNSGLLHLLSGTGVDLANDDAVTRSVDPSRANENLARVRYVSGLADMMRGGTPTDALQDGATRSGTTIEIASMPILLAWAQETKARSGGELASRHWTGVARTGRRQSLLLE